MSNVRYIPVRINGDSKLGIVLASPPDINCLMPVIVTALLEEIEDYAVPKITLALRHYTPNALIKIGVASEQASAILGPVPAIAHNWISHWLAANWKFAYIGKPVIEPDEHYTKGCVVREIIDIITGQVLEKSFTPINYGLDQSLKDRSHKNALASMSQHHFIWVPFDFKAREKIALELSSVIDDWNINYRNF